ncbi:MAG TPA: DUF2085 domain-containing protein [bacterium]|nr:DUF2085 domain-containing protein [bacterium]
MNPCFAWIYGIMSLVCHQQASRTWSLNGVFLPLCARCTGLYGGFLVSLVIQILTSYRKNFLSPTRLSTWLALLVILTMSVEGLGSASGWWHHSHTFRFGLGLAAGTAISFLLLPLFYSAMRRKHEKLENDGRARYWHQAAAISLVFSLCCALNPGVPAMFFFGW